MAKLPETVWADPTLLLVDHLIEEKHAKEPMRDYLGMSSIGDCARKQWLRLQGKREVFDAATIKRFDDGHRTEALIIQRLSLCDALELSTVDENGNQWSQVDFDGRFKGHMDGVVRGLLQAPKTWHVFEAKCVSEKSFKELVKAREKFGEKNALQNWNGTYHAQAVLYMDYSGLDRHWLVCATPGGRDWTSVRTEANKELAKALKAKAKRILDATEPPECTCLYSADFCNGN